MLVHVSLFLVVFTTAAMAVFVYRWNSNSHCLKRLEIVIPAVMAWIGRKIRQGILVLGPAPGERVKQVRLRGPKGGFKTPWGW